jgi:phosphoribosylanthranilate isomerase
MWIKICGNTNLEDARFAAQCGADAVGFVFAPSPRRVEADQVRQILQELPAELEKYGVFVDAGFDEIVSTVETCGLTGVQLHRSTDEGVPLRLKQHFAGRINILQVLNYKALGFEQQLKELSQNEDPVLVDSSTAKAVGGTGTSFDWKDARNTLQRTAPKLRLIAAGGLAPENVKEAIEILQPWGVDVVSGVESKPGKKDPKRVQAFIENSRATFSQPH